MARHLTKEEFITQYVLNRCIGKKVFNPQRWVDEAIEQWDLLTIEYQKAREESVIVVG